LIACKIKTCLINRAGNGMQTARVGFKKDPDPSLWIHEVRSAQLFEIIKQDIPKGVSYNDWLKMDISVQKDVLQSDDITIDGKNAHKIVRNNGTDKNLNTGETTPRKAITIFIDGGNKFYQLDWSMGEYYFNNNQNEINQILNSIYFTK